ncbi:MAG: substrate-binding periplasmic protein [Kangiellaceae bacterium]
MNNLRLSFLILSSITLISCNQQDSKETESNQGSTQVVVQPEESNQVITEDPNTISSQVKDEAKCELILGWDPWEPYQYLTPDNHVKGLDIELIQSTASQIGCSVKFEQGEWVDLLDYLKSGKIDMLGGASKTPSRESFAIFSDPYRHESFVLYLQSESVDNFKEKSIYELMDEKFRLGITEDYIYGDAISSIQENKAYESQIISVPITEVNYYNLTQGHIDGFLEDPFVAGYTIKRKGLSTQIVPSGIKVHSGDVSIMFSKASVKPKMVERFNIALDDIKDSGEYKKILDKYSH